MRAVGVVVTRLCAMVRPGLVVVFLLLLCLPPSELERPTTNTHGDDVPYKAGLQSSHAQEDRRNEPHVRLLRLIEAFSSVMSLEIDGELYQELKNEFETVLEEYNALGITCAGRVELIHAAILGAFRLQGNVIKDTLANGELKQVNRTSITEYAYWSLDFLKSILTAPMSGSECGISDTLSTPHEGRTALRLAIELRMLKVVQELIQKGGSVFHCGNKECGNDLEGVVCGFVDVLLPAVWNVDEEMIALLIREIITAQRTSSVSYHLQQENWLCHVLNKICGNTSTTVSPFQAAYLHCVLLSVCTAYDYLTSITGPHCQVNLDSTTVHLALHHGALVCPGFQLPTFAGTTTNLNYPIHKKLHGVPSSETPVKLGWGPRWAQRMSKSTQASGWAVYSDFSVGRVGCDLPRVRVQDLEGEAFRVYEQLRYARMYMLCVTAWMAKSSLKYNS